MVVNDFTLQPLIEPFRLVSQVLLDVAGILLQRGTEPLCDDSIDWFVSGIGKRIEQITHAMDASYRVSCAISRIIGESITETFLVFDFVCRQDEFCCGLLLP
jgi:hypothetical protein